MKFSTIPLKHNECNFQCQVYTISTFKDRYLNSHQQIPERSKKSYSKPTSFILNIFRVCEAVQQIQADQQYPARYPPDNWTKPKKSCGNGNMNY